jgi:CBS domain containing-hemolysin-like protein
VTGWFLLAALLLLVANAFFVAVEFALLASRVARLEPMAEDDDRRAAIALASIKDLQSQLAGAQLGITMASLGLGFVAEPAIATLIESVIESFVEIPSNLLHAISFTLALSLVVVVHMVIGEMVPKNIAIATPERSARILAPIHRVYVKLCAPIVWFLTAVSNGITRLLGMEPADELNTALTVNEFHRVIEGAVEEGKLEDLEHDLLDRALDFRARTAGSIMVPRSRMVTAPRSTSVADLEALVAESGHSRIPVTGRTLDDVVGFVHSKDLLRFAAADREIPVPLEMVRRMVIVTPDQPVRDLMRSMRRGRRHVALVRANDGRLLGMVTLEDVLEALVGDIADETDGGSDAAAPAPV